MDIVSRINALLNTLSSTCVMPLISVFYTGWLEASIQNIIGAVILTLIILFSPMICFRFLVSDELKSKIDSIENVNHLFLPVYLGYFFVTFSISDYRWFLAIYVLIVVLLSCSRLMYFNLFLLCLGYSFYKVHTVNGISCYIISKRYVLKDDISFLQLKRLNNMTFLEWPNESDPFEIQE